MVDAREESDWGNERKTERMERETERSKKCRSKKIHVAYMLARPSGIMSLTRRNIHQTCNLKVSKGDCFRAEARYTKASSVLAETYHEP